MKFKFEYALVSPSGKYYTGCTGEKMLSENVRDAFTYTYEGAEVKKAKFYFFKYYSIVKVI